VSPEATVLEARVRRELEQLRRLKRELEAIMKPYRHRPVTSTTVLRALGSILHDFYSGVEKIFINVAKEIDRTMPKAEGWHRLLLEQMTLQLNRRRPPVIDTELAEELLGYLAFRHRFRNLYGFDLEWKRMEGLIRSLPETLDRFAVRIESFLEALEKAGDE